MSPVFVANASPQVFFVTNNSAANPVQLRDKLTQILQFESSATAANDNVVLTPEMMISTAFTAAQFLKQQFSQDSPSNPKRRVYVIGSAGLRTQIEQTTGCQVLYTDDKVESAYMTRDELASYDFAAHLGLDDESTVDAVVVGHDTEFGFRKLCIANVLLQRNPRALLVATNLDAFDLVGADGRQLPGNGSLVKALEHCSGRQAVDCGKPSALLAQLLQDLYGVDTSRAMFVGDRLDTDIVFAKNTGMHACLVLTGVTNAALLQSLDKQGTVREMSPDLVVPHVGYFAG